MTTSSGAAPTEAPFPDDPAAGRLVPCERILFVVDLARYVQLCRTTPDATVARFIDGFYRTLHGAITEAGGTFINFMGDACLATFPIDHAPDALDLALALAPAVNAAAAAAELDVEFGANLHAATVIEGPFGLPAVNRLDVIGLGVNEAFLLGRGAGIRMSPAFHRLLPEERAAGCRPVAWP